MVHFPVTGPIDAITYGTPYHWDRKAPARAGHLTFEAIHDFLVPSFNGTPRSPSSTPACRRGRYSPMAWWSARSGATRRRSTATSTAPRAPTPRRTPSTTRGALPAASAAPEQGQQLREALAFQTPLQAVAGAPSGTLPREFSLASTSPDAAIITAAKAGTADPETLILRIYQPTETALHGHCTNRCPAPVSRGLAARRARPYGARVGAAGVRSGTSGAVGISRGSSASRRRGR